MTVLFYSDPHIGLTRKANTTAESNKLREEWNLDSMKWWLNDEDSMRFCLGDFFDKTTNPEEVILSALPIMELTDLILSGNHDMSNREGKESSLRLLQEIAANKILIADQQINDGFATEVGQTLFCFAPHCLTQDGYMAMIDGLVKEAEGYSGYRMLCLHCNWDMSPDRLTESTLNLTKEKAEELFATFHFILMGHVHTPADLYDGRLRIIGSMFPTAFDNMSDKRVLRYDPDYGSFEEQVVWKSSEHFYSGPASECPAEGLQYYDLLDDLDRGKAQKLAVSLLKNGAFGVRLRKPEEGVSERQEFTTAQFSNLALSIEQELKEHKPHLQELWREVTA